MLYFFIAMFLTMSSLFFKHKLIWILSGCIFFMMYFQVFMVSIMGAAIYYRPENWYIYIIFVLGLLLIIAEVYIPVFGIVGLIGASLSTYILYVF